MQYLPKTADKQKLVSTSDSADYTPCVAVDDSAPHIVVECGTGLADGEKETDKASLIQNKKDGSDTKKYEKKTDNVRLVFVTVLCLTQFVSIHVRRKRKIAQIMNEKV